MRLFFFLRFCACIVLVFPLMAQESALHDQWRKPFVGAAVSLSNSVGSGTFLREYERQSSFSSSLNLHPHLSFPIYSDKKLKIGAEQNISIEWLESQGASRITPARKVNFSDLIFRTSIKNALNFSTIGLSFTPAFEVEIPISKASAIANRLVSLGGFVSMRWSKWGFFASYKPSIMAYIHNEPYRTIPCGDTDILTHEEGMQMASALDPRRPDFGVQEHFDVMIPARLLERLPDGRCMISGRQNMALMKHGLFAGYAFSRHSFTLGFRSYHAFLRPLAPRPELTGKHASSQIFKESTLGLIEYSYAFPTPISFSMTIGVSSYQPSFDARGSFRFPFFDFLTPRNNHTQFYLGLDFSV